MKSVKLLYLSGSRGIIMIIYGCQPASLRKGMVSIMSKVVVFLADGHEECEALIPADLLRRAGVEVVLASITGKCGFNRCCRTGGNGRLFRKRYRGMDDSAGISGSGCCICSV